MSNETEETRNNAPKATLTGEQVAFVRYVLGENRKEFGARFDISEAKLGRIETAAADEHSGPTIILIQQIVDKTNLQFPDFAAIRAAVAVGGDCAAYNGDAE